ncbi:hypothetical protein KP79_PYT13181 [Mizuhopecten yessoensis]|uniref:Death domain-containing protein n=1 Tax=Mizuhopecten yessoensis TaxID=6573 RepID=A0A210Q695_MIZYE|nr:hypothetical protein KP79_PYT13181 [Mizuhopecten yessoensis]
MSFRSCTSNTPDTEESNPLNTCTIEVEPDCQAHEQAYYTYLENDDDPDEADNEQLLDKRRPNQKCVCFLSKLLAPDKKYKDFAKEMGLPQYKTKLLEEELKQRNLNPEDISYEYTSRTLQSMPAVSYNDIYDALTDLGLDDERTILREKRHKFIR